MSGSCCLPSVVVVVVAVDDGRGVVELRPVGFCPGTLTVTYCRLISFLDTSYIKKCTEICDCCISDGPKKRELKRAV